MSQFLFRLRTQFSFVVNNKTLGAVLQGIAKSKVNINGYESTKIGRNLNQVRLVVGVTNFETAQDLRVVKRVLQNLGVKYHAKKILQMYGFPAEVPGILNTLYHALGCKTRVIASYFGEKSKIYIDVANLAAAIRVLSQKKLPVCP
ncbi:hypothetical protein JZ785_19480 [Alicyclobacillus curvatus]|nr:hypothetical protein JZ785_19480 [Alicyclobacillus curvatus]